jgi:hypothetical protein
VLLQIRLDLAAQIVLPLGYLKRAEEPGRGFHLLPLLGEIIVQ